MSCLTYTLEPDGDDNPFLEREEEGAEQVVEIDYLIDYTYTKGDPGCRYTRNGDGWPPSGPEVDWQATCKQITMQSGEQRKPTETEASLAVAWLAKHRDKHIYELACEDYAERMEDNRW